MDTKNVTVKMVLDSWNDHLKKFNEVITSLSDEDLNREVYPGRSRAFYLLGHMIAVHDNTMKLFGFGNPQYPELYEIFARNKDRDIDHNLTISQLKEYWENVNDTLNENFLKLSADEWFEKHTAVSDEDFAKEPHRNKLNIVLTRTNHLQYHFGQITFVQSKFNSKK